MTQDPQLHTTTPARTFAWPIPALPPPFRHPRQAAPTAHLSIAFEDLHARRIDLHRHHPPAHRRQRDDVAPYPGKGVQRHEVRTLLSHHKVRASTGAGARGRRLAGAGTPTAAAVRCPCGADALQGAKGVVAGDDLRGGRVPALWVNADTLVKAAVNKQQGDEAAWVRSGGGLGTGRCGHGHLVGK